jgi:hypothetical protein
MSTSHDISDVSPTPLNHLIGQRAVVEQGRVALDAARLADTRGDRSGSCRKPRSAAPTDRAAQTTVAVIFFN